MHSLKTVLATAALAVVASMHSPAMAGEATPWPELMMKAADSNRDGQVTRQEFLDHMARVWDQKHAQMKKTDAAMKTGMMDATQFMTFVRVMFIDPGKIGG